MAGHLHASSQAARIAGLEDYTAAGSQVAPTLGPTLIAGPGRHPRQTYGVSPFRHTRSGRCRPIWLPSGRYADIITRRAGRAANDGRLKRAHEGATFACEVLAAAAARATLTKSGLAFRGWHPPARKEGRTARRTARMSARGAQLLVLTLTDWSELSWVPLPWVQVGIALI
jgi:hypothetical protein